MRTFSVHRCDTLVRRADEWPWGATAALVLGLALSATLTAPLPALTREACRTPERRRVRALRGGRAPGWPRAEQSAVNVVDGSGGAHFTEFFGRPYTSPRSPAPTTAATGGVWEPAGDRIQRLLLPPRALPWPGTRPDVDRVPEGRGLLGTWSSPRVGPRHPGPDQQGLIRDLGGANRPTAWPAPPCRERPTTAGDRGAG